jgi:hypothetical protein
MMPRLPLTAPPAGSLVISVDTAVTDSSPAQAGLDASVSRPPAVERRRIPDLAKNTGVDPTAPEAGFESDLTADRQMKFTVSVPPPRRLRACSH